MQMLDRPNHNPIRLYCVVNAVRESLDQVTPDIILDYAPHVGSTQNDFNSCFHLINEGVTQARYLVIVVAPGSHELSQGFVNETMPHFRKAARTSLSPSVPSTRIALPERTAERRSRISSR